MVEMTLCSECHGIIDGRMFGRTVRGDRWCEECWQIVNADEIAADAACDRWHNGYFAKERPTDPDELAGWLQAKQDRARPVPQIARPEGYYHMPLGTFD